MKAIYCKHSPSRLIRHRAFFMYFRCKFYNNCPSVEEIKVIHFIWLTSCNPHYYFWQFLQSLIKGNEQVRRVNELAF